MKDKVKEFFQKQPHAKIKVKELARKIEANSAKQYAELKEALYFLTKEDFIVRRGKRFEKVKSSQKKLIGTFQLSKEGTYAFVILKKSKLSDIFIPEKYFGLAFHGDTVEVKVLKKSRGKNLEGEIVKVVERKNEKIIGTLVKRKKLYFVEPKDKTLQRLIFVDEKDLDGAKVGDLVEVADLILSPRSSFPEGIIISNFGAAGSFKAEISSIAKEFDITEEFPKQVEDELKKIRPWRSAVNKTFLANIDGENCIEKTSHRETIKEIRANLSEFKTRCDSGVVINLASTEKLIDENAPILGSLASFENALDSNSSEISPAMLYAYAAISEGVPDGNFTPSVAADIPALVEFAEKEGVPIAGKDGKTGQTFIKTVIAPALRSRALKVEGWYSTNILGNRDGLALSNEDSLASKIKTKASVLRSILGYEVEDHIVDIRYYKPRGDNKEAWDNVDVKGFLGQSMQLKINFLCKDSILAAPLAIEIARCLDLAKTRGAEGIQEQLSVFFKLPMSKTNAPEHAFHKQEEMFFDWLRSE